MPIMSEAAYRFCIEETLCSILKMGELVSGERASYREILLAYPEPSYAGRYSEIFRCQVRFGAACTAALVDRAWFEKPLLTHDEHLKRFYGHYLGRLEQQIQSRTSLADRAREILLRCPARSLPSQAELAERLQVSARSLSRALKDEGTTYRDLVEAVRMHAVSLSLSAGRTSAKGLAFQAGYRDVNAFRRAFKKWTGLTVGQY
jgi:AraC-like DNA-binding protein